MKIALVAPLDLSFVLFCKGIVDNLNEINDIELVLISDVHGKDNYCSNIIKKWNVKFIPIKCHRYVNLIKDLNYIFSLYKIFKKEKFDAVINIATKPNIYGSIAGHFANVNKIFCSVWGRGSVFVDNKKSVKEKLIKFILLKLYKRAFNVCSKVWFTNQYDLNYFKSVKLIDNNKIILTKNYVPTDDYAPYILSHHREVVLRNELKMKKEDKLVVMVGRLIWAKGVREFVESSKILKDKLPWLKFVFIGPVEKGISDVVPESYLRENEKTGNFIWTGFRKDVKDIYALADLAVLPSYYKEGGYPRALTEPMSMGKPIIAADSPDCRGPVEHEKNGYLIPIKNSKALADGIEKIMLDDSLRETMGKYSRKKAVRDFDEKMIVHDVLSKMGFDIPTSVMN
jgi:N,N'-diacetylbacillosaminyl-diphospho-undecaprenol alpha-1,3-N-acetylgalactosaminyltransferase